MIPFAALNVRNTVKLKFFFPDLVSNLFILFLYLIIVAHLILYLFSFFYIFYN